MSLGLEALLLSWTWTAQPWEVRPHSGFWALGMLCGLRAGGTCSRSFPAGPFPSPLSSTGWKLGKNWGPGLWGPACGRGDVILVSNLEGIPPRGLGLWWGPVDPGLLSAHMLSCRVWRAVPWDGAGMPPAWALPWAQGRSDCPGLCPYERPGFQRELCSGRDPSSGVHCSLTRGSQGGMLGASRGVQVPLGSRPELPGCPHVGGDPR